MEWRNLCPADLTRGGEVEDRGDRGTEKDRGEGERYPVREIKKIERGMQRFGFWKGL
jgi:hypothetical protein